ncbi:MAG: U32 family peptidase [Spirochaetes bacterium]|nr:U32 family peptidase [Spirochaetota bacterium]
MRKIEQHSIELLAPAGSPEAFIVALQAGADAVYLGLKDFNARKRAKNFTIDEFKFAVNYAHHHDKKVYLTLNTLIFDSEFEQVIDILDVAEDVKVDAVIVQDIGLIHLMRTYFPSLAIHASTQTFCHNSLHAQFLKNLGVSRIILPRELSLNEIKSIVHKVPLDYEVFIHGAMCFSFSGCCLFSSYLFGESGNRGRCLQPCRFPFAVSNKTRYPFSMKDLAIGPSILDYINAGITNFKIEGRLKSTWYIKDVVSYYRKLIDSLFHGTSYKSNPPTLRNSSKGYMFDSSYEKLVDTQKPGVAGTFIGTVITINSNSCIIKTIHNITKGARLRIIDRFGKKIHEGTLLHYTYNANQGILTWFIRIKGETPMDVYQIGESRELSYLQQLKKVPYKPYIAHVHIDIDHQININASIKDFSKEYCVQVPVQKALAHELSACNIEEIFQQTSSFPFTAIVTVNVKDGIFIPLSVVKQIRRDVYSKLYNDFKLYLQHNNQTRKSKIAAYIKSIQEDNSAIVPTVKTHHYIEFENIQHSQINAETFIELPVFVPQNALDDTIQKIDMLIANGHTRFIIPTYGWLEYFKNKNAIVCAGDYCYIVNSYTYQAFKHHGISYFTVSEDLQNSAFSILNYKEYIKFKTPRRYMITRLCMPDAILEHKGKKFCVQHYKYYDILTDCTQ